MEQILNQYYADNAKKLHSVVDKIFYKEYGGVAGRDMEEFYGIATDVFVEIIKNNSYEPSKGDFDGYLYKALKLAIVDELKRQQRAKRCAKTYETDTYGNKLLDENGKPKFVIIPDLRLDAPIGEDKDLTIGDTIQADFDMDIVLSEVMEECRDEKVERYLNGLSKVQRRIVEMRMEDIPVSVIKAKLELSDKEYKHNFRELRSFANISIFHRNEKTNMSKEDDLEMTMTTQTMENCKTDKISINSIVKKIDKHTIRFDHPLQRESDQWSPSMKGNLVSDILQGNKLHPLIFAEQIINGVPIIWDLDGKQRCSNAYSFSRDGYRVSRNIRRWIIKYQTIKKDNDGKEILDDNGFPIAINAEFDIRGKKFSDLPEELQDRFLDYSFNYDQYLNCSEEDIGYHIERYNDGKPMTSPQRGITKLGTEYAEMVKSISNMPFFKDMGGYKVSEFKNGTINRVVVESIMAANYLDKWNKLEDMCKFIKENSNMDVFDEFEDMVERLERVVTDEVSDLYDSKDSFLWFGLFARFIKTETDDQKFIEFLTEYMQSLHSKAIDGVSFDEILTNSKSTKDKGIVIKKMNHLERLMNEYLQLQEQAHKTDGSMEAFIAENLGVEKEEIQEDMDFYEESLDALLETAVKVDSKLRKPQNRPSLLAMMVYSYKEDRDLDKWMTEYARRNNTYLTDQRKNFISMKKDYERFAAYENKKMCRR